MTAPVRRVGLVFSGGPAPAANAVISAAATSFLDAGAEVVGFFHGYSNLVDYHPIARRMLPDVHYRVFRPEDLRGLRNTRGIVIGTSRANPGTPIRNRADLADPEKTAKLATTYTALVDLGIDALVSIGGDGTLKTANLLVKWQASLPPEAKRVRVVHLPKTIDNDYQGIDFTFGFFTAVDTMARELENLAADAQATSSYFVVETMGRKAGWLAYGVGIAGEASLTVSVEDLLDPSDPQARIDPLALAERIVDLMVQRSARGQHSGTVVLAEGLAERLPDSWLQDAARDPTGQISLGKVDLARLMSGVIADRFHARTGQKKKVTGVQLGYEARCAAPNAFDVMLGSQLGIGAFRALVEEGLDGHMVSVGGQLDLRFVPFDALVNPETMTTEMRYLAPGSDFHRLARFLESRASTRLGWSPGPRVER
jgi:6-phosphofructokinase